MQTPKYLAYKTQILGHTWTVFYCSEKFFKSKHGDACLGATEIDDREIYLRHRHLKFEVVVHELCHAYLEELCTTPADLTAAQIEEICCDMFGKYGRKILSQAEKILTAYEVLKARAARTRRGA